MKKEGNVLVFFCKRTKRSPILLRSFAKERCILCVLFRSLQNDVVFFAFFSILCKRTLRSLYSFPFFRKERKRTECSFGSHKSPKTQKKNRKERNVPFKELKRTERTERKRTPCLTLLLCVSLMLAKMVNTRVK